MKDYYTEKRQRKIKHYQSLTNEQLNAIISSCKTPEDLKEKIWIS